MPTNCGSRVDKKLPYYANLYVNIAFAGVIDSATAEMLLASGAELSYTQLGLLALVGRHEDFPLPPSNRKRQTQLEWRHVTVRASLDDLGLAKKDLAGVDTRTREGKLATNLGVPADLRLHERGRLLFDAMELQQFPAEELEGLCGDLWFGSAETRSS